MKKIGKKLSYITKVFLAVGLLFNNLSSLSIVFADEIEGSTDPVVTETAPEVGVTDDETNLGDEEANNPPAVVDDGDNPVVGDDNNGNGDNETTPEDENPTGEEVTTGGENGEQPQGGEEPSGEGETPTEPEVALKFEVSVNDDNQIVVKHNKALDLSEESELSVVEDFKYLDGSYYGAEEHKIALTEDVRNALASDEGYSVESAILPENVYAGEYSVNAYIGEAQALTSKVIEAEGEGVEFKLYTADEVEVTAEADGVYYFESDEKSFIVTARLLNGGVSPSDKVTIAGVEIAASELFDEGQILEEALEGYLHGEFEYKVSLDYSLSGNAKTAEDTFDIFYLNYSDNTDGLNESAKNVGLDNKYVFVGGYADNIVYNLGTEDIEEILKDFVGDDGIITYEINTDNGLVVTLTDGRVTITYEEATLDSSRAMDARLEADNIEVATGDTLTVKYLVTLNDDPINGYSGLIKYDQELLRLTSVESSAIEDGGVNDNAFLYAQWVMLQADSEEDENGNISYKPTDYTLVTFTFEALKAGEANISIEDARFYQRDVYLEPAEELSTNVTITESSDNSLASLTVAGQDIPLEEGVFEYSIEVENDVTSADVEAVANNSSSNISMVYPEELVEGENTIRIVVTAANGEKQEYVITVTRKAKEEEQEETSTVSPISYNDDTYDDNSNVEPDKIIPADDDDQEETDDQEGKDEKGNNLSRIIIILLILLVIAGLIYLIFKDDDDEEEKQANKDINKFKNDDFDKPQPKKTEHKPNNNKANHNRNNQSNKNNKKGR